MLTTVYIKANENETGIHWQWGNLEGCLPEALNRASDRELAVAISEILKETHGVILSPDDLDIWPDADIADVLGLDSPWEKDPMEGDTQSSTCDYQDEYDYPTGGGYAE